MSNKMTAARAADGQNHAGTGNGDTGHQHRAPNKRYQGPQNRRLPDKTETKPLRPSQIGRIPGLCWEMLGYEKREEVRLIYARRRESGVCVGQTRPIDGEKAEGADKRAGNKL
jgi:hypothetical protein